jgi:hypothetical protein
MSGSALSQSFNKKARRLVIFKSRRFKIAEAGRIHHLNLNCAEPAWQPSVPDQAQLMVKAGLT